MTETTLLAVELGTRELGFAVFQRGRLVQSGVKSLRRTNPHANRVTVLKRVFTSLIEQNAPSAIVVVRQEVNLEPQNDIRRRLFEAVKLMAENNKLLKHEYPMSTVKKTVTGESRATNRRVASVLCGIYPHFTNHLECKQKWRKRYIQHMFDAVACGLTHLTLETPNSNDDNEVKN